MTGLKQDTQWSLANVRVELEVPRDNEVPWRSNLLEIDCCTSYIACEHPDLPTILQIALVPLTEAQLK